MDQLPQEVFDLIIQNVDFTSLPSRRAYYATISRQWQYAVEQRLFANLTVWCHEMSMLEYILLDSRRRGYLDVLHYRIAGTFRNRKTELSFGTAQTTYCQLNYELKQLWNFLRLYWGQASVAKVLNLEVGIFTALEFTAREERDRVPSSGLGFKTPHVPWTPPLLPGVGKLALTWGDLDEEMDVMPQQDYHPMWLFNLLHTCPSATEIVWRGFEEYAPAKVAGTAYRERLCKSLAFLDRMGNLQRLELKFDTPKLLHNTGDISACRHVTPNTLNRLLHKLSQQLVALRLKGRFLLSPDLFWPKIDIDSAPGSSQAPFWPRLKEVAVEARLASPEGLFYFRPWFPLIEHPMTVRGDMENSVGSSDASAARELLVRVTRAMLQMPELEELLVQFPEHPLGGLFVYNKQTTLYWGTGGSCQVDGICTSRREFPHPWRWHWDWASRPAEIDENWDKLAERLCQTSAGNGSQ